MREQTVTKVIEAIDEYGYCVLPGVLPATHADELRGIIDDLRAREPRSDTDALGHHRVVHLAAKHPRFVELMCHPVPQAIWNRLLGEDFICSTWTSNTLMPHSSQNYWHVDHPYWAIAAPYPVDPLLTGQTIWCLDDFSLENGGTKFVPGSHRRPFIPEHDRDYDHEGVTVTAPRGSLILGHGACWHSAGTNTTDAPRTGVFGRYARSYIVLQEDMRAQLAAISNPSPLVERLLGAKQYVPSRGFPY